MSNKLKPFEEADENTQEIVKRVLELEKDRLEQRRPRVNSEIIEIIKDIVK